MLKKLFCLLFVAFISIGCQQKHFSHVYDKTELGANVETICIKHNEKNNTINIEQALKKHDFTIKPKSSYQLQINSRLYPKRCNNPLATAEQKSYIGFVQLTLFKKQKRIYMCQSDFRKRSEIKDIADGLVDILTDEMALRVR